MLAFLKCAVGLLLVIVHASQTTCSEDNLTFPYVELTASQRQTLLNIADFLELLPCEQRQKCLYEMTEPPIELTDTQLNGLAQRYGGSFQNPSDVGGCQEDSTPIFESEPSVFERYRQRRAVTPTPTPPPTPRPGTAVCRAVEEANKVLYLAYSKNGGLVYIAQPTFSNGFVQQQLFYESTCLDDECEGHSCSCSTRLVPAAKAVVHVIQNNVATFSEEIVMTRTCFAFTP